jgi:VWFA-related protein
MVLVPVTVLDQKGGTVDNLRQENFTIIEDQAPQRISSFFCEDSPCAIGLVLDVSGSMRNALGGAKDVVRAFLETSNPEDEFFARTVYTQSEEVSGFTTSRR